MLCSSTMEIKNIFRKQGAPLFSDIQNIVHKYVGIDQIVDQIVNDLGAVKNIPNW